MTRTETSPEETEAPGKEPRVAEGPVEPPPRLPRRPRGILLVSRCRSLGNPLARQGELIYSRDVCLPFAFPL